MKLNYDKIHNFKQLYLIFTLCNIFLFVYIAVCAIVDSFHLWPRGDLMSIWILIALLIPSGILLRINYFISRKKDTLRHQFLLSCLFIIYSPFYSFRVMKKGWIKK